MKFSLLLFLITLVSTVELQAATFHPNLEKTFSIARRFLRFTVEPQCQFTGNEDYCNAALVTYVDELGNSSDNPKQDIHATSLVQAFGLSQGFLVLSGVSWNDCFKLASHKSIRTRFVGYYGRINKKELGSAKFCDYIKHHIQPEPTGG